MTARALLPAAIIAAVLAPATPASAEPLELAGDPPKVTTPPAKPAEPLSIDVDAGLGWSVGATRIGEHTYAQVGARFSLGLRVGRVSVGGAYEVGSTNRDVDGELLDGQRHRFSAGVAADVHRWGGPILFGETRVGAGVGRELIAWEQGALSRRDAFVSVEQAIGFHLPPTSGRRAVVGPRALLYAFGLQLTGSRTPPLAFQPLAASVKRGGELDLGVLFTMGLQFRR